MKIKPTDIDTSTAQDDFVIRYKDGVVQWDTAPTGSGGGSTGGDGVASSLYRFGGFFSTTPAAAEVLMMHAVTDDFTLPANMTGTEVIVGTNPTAEAVFTLAKNGASIGTITIAVDGTVTLATADAAEISVVTGDSLTVVAPAIADATIAYVSYTFRGKTVEKPTTVTSLTGDYTLTIADAGSYLRFSAETAVVCTIPANATTAFSVGTQINLRQAGAGSLSVVGASEDVVINLPSDFTKVARTQHSTLALINVATDEWDLTGDLEAA